MTRERRRSIDKGVECRKMKGKSRREQRVQGSRCMRRKDETSDSDSDCDFIYKNDGGGTSNDIHSKSESIY
ncbi:hypothetical protein ACS0TY_006431 [Phlomoides rotata]